MAGFYSPIFSSVQKKEISGFVTYMWHADPFKAKWTILAKAYSAIRDAQGKANAPLDQFLTLNTPLVGIIEPPRYLEALGWNFIVEGDGHIVVQREEPRFDADSLTTDISVNGVIQNCHMQGYITGPLSDILLANDESILTVSQASSLVRDEGVGEEVADPQTSQGGTPAPGYQSVGEQDSDTHMPEPIDNSLSTPSTYTDGLSEANVSSTPEVLQPVIFSEATQALLPAQYKLPQGEFVLDEAFDPLLYGEQTVFDPFAGNQFDAFDWMDGWNEYVNLDACS